MLLIVMNHPPFIHLISYPLQPSSTQTVRYWRTKLTQANQESHWDLRRCNGKVQQGVEFVNSSFFSSSTNYIFFCNQQRLSDYECKVFWPRPKKSVRKGRTCCYLGCSSFDLLFALCIQALERISTQTHKQRRSKVRQLVLTSNTE